MATKIRLDIITPCVGGPRPLAGQSGKPPNRNNYVGVENAIGSSWPMWLVGFATQGSTPRAGNKVLILSFGYVSCRVGSDYVGSNPAHG